MPSEKILNEKKAQVTNLAEKLKGACAGVIVSYKGINVEDDTKLRKELREAGLEYMVVKNTMLSRASSIVGMESLNNVLEGTTALALSKDDCISAARVLCKFSEDHEFYKIKAGFVEGNVMTGNEIHQLSKLPSREVLVSRVLGGLNSPIAGFVGVLNGTIRGLVVALNAICEKKSA